MTVFRPLCKSQLTCDSKKGLICSRLFMNFSIHTSTNELENNVKFTNLTNVQDVEFYQGYFSFVGNILKSICIFLFLCLYTFFILFIASVLIFINDDLEIIMLFDTCLPLKKYNRASSWLRTTNTLDKPSLETSLFFRTSVQFKCVFNFFTYTLALVFRFFFIHVLFSR